MAVGAEASVPSVAWEGALRNWETVFRNGRPRGCAISGDLFVGDLQGQDQGILPSAGSALAARSALKFRPWWGLGGEAGDWSDTEAACCSSGGKRDCTLHPTDGLGWQLGGKEQLGDQRWTAAAMKDWGACRQGHQ